LVGHPYRRRNIAFTSSADVIYHRGFYVVKYGGSKPAPTTSNYNVMEPANVVSSSLLRCVKCNA